MLQFNHYIATNVCMRVNIVMKQCLKHRERNFVDLIFLIKEALFQHKLTKNKNKNKNNK